MFTSSAVQASGARDFRQVDLHARAHRRGDAELLNELALRARRLVADDRFHERGEVLLEVALGEARLADAGVDDARLLDTELDLARLGVGDRLVYILVHRSELRVRHKALGPSTLPSLPTTPIMSGVAITRSK